MSQTTDTPVKQDVYTIVTNRIIELLEAGTIPWRKPWATAGLPQNLITKKPYKGVNVWLLSALNYTQNYFLTWNQIQELGAKVNEGERAHLVVFFKWVDKAGEPKPDNEEKPKKKPMLRYYKVFNVAQCSGIPETKIPKIELHDNDPIEACEDIVTGMPNPPLIHHEAPAAFYSPSEDYINMPKLELFKNSENYYATLFHEMTHSTGHASRLARKGITELDEMSSESYSFEELVAEMGACYLNSYAFIANSELSNSAAYIDGWLKKLKSDKRLVVYAGSYAQKAVEYILNTVLEEKVPAEN